MQGVKIIPIEFNHQIGQSKFGGWPELPQSIEIPQVEVPAFGITTNLAFICQLNLADFQNDFADSGMLYFFTTIYPDCIEGCKVVYYNGAESLQEQKAEIVKYVQWRETPLYSCEYPLKEFSFRFEPLDEPSVVIVQNYYRDENNYPNNVPTIYTGSKFMGIPYLEQPAYFEDGGDHHLLLQLNAEDFGRTFEGVCGTDGLLYFTIPVGQIQDKNADKAIAWMGYT